MKALHFRDIVKGLEISFRLRNSGDGEEVNNQVILAVLKNLVKIKLTHLRLHFFSIRN